MKSVSWRFRVRHVRSLDAAAWSVLRAAVALRMTALSSLLCGHPRTGVLFCGCLRGPSRVVIRRCQGRGKRLPAEEPRPRVAGMQDGTFATVRTGIARGVRGFNRAMSAGADSARAQASGSFTFSPFFGSFMNINNFTIKYLRNWHGYCFVWVPDQRHPHSTGAAP